MLERIPHDISSGSTSTHDNSITFNLLVIGDNMSDIVSLFLKCSNVLTEKHFEIIHVVKFTHHYLIEFVKVHYVLVLCTDHVVLDKLIDKLLTNFIP